jgi:dihydrofolate reductase
MRTVIYGAACSLDGFIAAPDGAVDWLHFSKDAQQIMTAFWARIDTVLMGRKTYEVAASGQGGGGGLSPVETFVFSRTLKRIDQPGVQLVSQDAAGFVRALKSKKGKGICVLGGGDFANSLFAAGLIDEVGLNIHPILLGSGVPFFLDAHRRIALELAECRQLVGGCVLLTYRVKH